MNCIAKLLLVAMALGGAPLAAQESDPDDAKPVDIANPGFEDELAGWSSTGEDDIGYRVVIDDDAAEGEKSAMFFSTRSPSERGFGALSQSIDAQELRGRRIRLTARVKVNPSNPPSKFGLWLRVDRKAGRPGFFDNMGDRPLSGFEWHEYTIEGDVARDAEKVVFGLLLTGRGMARFDAVELEDIGPASSAGVRSRVGPPRDAPTEGDVAVAPIDPRGIQNLRAFARLYGLVRWFHPSDEAATTDWDTLAIAAIPRVEAAETPEELADALKAAFAPVAPGIMVAAGDVSRISPDPESYGPKIAWVHKGLGSGGSVYSSERVELPPEELPPPIAENLPGGVAVRLATSLGVSNGRTLPVASDPLLEPVKPRGWMPAGFDRTTRLAATISAWAMLDHFYPYWDTVEVDWDSELPDLFQAAANAEDDRAYKKALRELVARIGDGHGTVIYTSDFATELPLDWDWIEDRLVVTAVSDGAGDIAPDTVVESIDGVAAADALKAEMALVSGSRQHRRRSALYRLRASGEPGEMTLGLLSPDGETKSVDVALTPLAMDERPAEPRPDNFSEMSDGIIYVDITRTTNEQFAEQRDRLAAAQGHVFDVRGYPRNSPAWLAHLLDETGRSPKFLLPIITAPDAPFDYPEDGGWRFEPDEPHFAAPAVFLTDKRAISYSESVLGMVRQNSLGPIVGSATAGANGNIARFDLPGGYQIIFTGMKVINRDGTQHHLIGIEPDVTILPTIAGIREGRDEVLERGLVELRALIDRRDAG